MALMDWLLMYRSSGCLKTVLSGDYSFTPYNGKLYFNFQCICTHQVWNRIVKRQGSCTKTTIYYKRFSILYNDRPCKASLACHSLRTMGFFGPPCVIVHVFDEILYFI